MIKLKVKLVEGEMEYDQDKYPKNQVLMGGDMSNPSWKKYREGYDARFHPSRSVHYKMTGGDRANDWYFEFSDGSQWGFSWRAWGDLMQAVENKNKGYMEYYM